MKTCHIYHHNDLDGRTSGAIIYKALQTKFANEGILEDYNFTFTEIDYTRVINEKIKSDDMYVFVDYSFSNPENIKFLAKLGVANCDLVWIDHHQTSETLVKSDKAKELHLDRLNASVKIDKTYCAAYLCYQAGMEAIGIEPDESKIPDLIKYIDSYDSWKFNMPKTAEFNDGAYVSEVRPQTWIDGILGEGAKPYAIFKPDAVQARRIQKYVKNCIDMGTSIQAYKAKENAYLVGSKSFEFRIEDMRDMLHVKEYKCLAINARGNSSVFGAMNDAYDIVCLFSFNGKVWKYSFYTVSDDIDLSKYAKLLGGIDGLGGGGHKQAAGFQTKDLLIYADEAIEIFRSKFGKHKYVINSTGSKKIYRYKLT